MAAFLVRDNSLGGLGSSPNDLISGVRACRVLRSLQESRVDVQVLIRLLVKKMDRV